MEADRRIIYVSWPVDMYNIRMFPFYLRDNPYLSNTITYQHLYDRPSLDKWNTFIKNSLKNNTCWNLTWIPLATKWTHPTIPALTNPWARHAWIPTTWPVLWTLVTRLNDFVMFWPGPVRTFNAVDITLWFKAILMMLAVQYSTNVISHCQYMFFLL